MQAVNPDVTVFRGKDVSNFRQILVFESKSVLFDRSMIDANLIKAPQFDQLGGGFLNMLSRNLFACAAAALTLAACGGDSGGSAPAPTPAPLPPPPAAVPAPSGLYAGTTSNTSNPELQYLALENGIVWGIYGRTVSGTFLVAGLLNASGAANNGSYAATDLRDYSPGGTSNGTVSGSYTAAGALNGVAISTAGTVSFTTNKVTAANYNYDIPAQLSAVTGSWSGTTLDGTATTVTISSAGAVSGNSNGCMFTGTIAPRGTGKNVYDVAITFGSMAACDAPNLAATGIGITYPISGTTRSQFLVGVQNLGRTAGDAFIAIR